MSTQNRVKRSLIFLICIATGVCADDQTDEYILKWAAFTGYNLSNDPPSSPLSTLINATNTALAEQYSLFTLFGALTVNAFNSNLSAFAPSDSVYGKLLNPLANTTFANYKTPSSTSSVSISALIDQPANPQNDPVSQFITNVLTTPNLSYCLNNDGTKWLDSCPYPLYDSEVTANVLGKPLPGPTDYFNYAYNQNVIPQLNSATLLTPLMYSTTSNDSQSGSSNQNTSTAGLTASNQLQDATNFIRYLSGALIKPMESAHFNDYNDAYTIATDATGTLSVTNITTAQNSILNYLADLRTYSAQMSVAMNNLYGILSSRIPQKQTDGSTTSSALSLFQLATRRLYDPNVNSNNQWINQINQASNATVNKEIATTLADILYMLYVLHQDNERQLLTSSTQLMTYTHSPAFESPTQSTDDTSNSSTTS
jgi:intracellular multiplication protein IcmX